MDKKKKMKKGKKKRKNKEPLMSDKEAILVYKLSVAEEKLHQVKQEAQAWKEKNERHIKRNHRLHSDQNLLIDRLLNQFRETEAKWNSEEVVGKDVVIEALQDKWKRVEDHKKVISDLNQEILSTNQEIEEVEKNIKYWKLYGEKGQFDDRKYIDRLEKQLSDLHQCHNYLQTALADQLVREKDTVQEVTTEKLECQKKKATKNVVSLMPKHCCLKMKDNGWLKREVELHIKEHEELSESVSKLERNNLKKMKQLFEINMNNLRISRNAILNQCSENDDLEARPSDVELDLANITDNWSSWISIDTDSNVLTSDYSRPSSSFFLTQDNETDYLKLGPLDWKQLSVHGHRASLHELEPLTEEEEKALKHYPEQWPITKPMLRSLNPIKCKK